MTRTDWKQINLRLRDSDIAAIDRAMSATGEASRTNFIRIAAIKEAERILKKKGIAMKTKAIALIGMLILSACGREFHPPTTCAGNIDGVNFTYAYTVPGANKVITDCTADTDGNGEVDLTGRAGFVGDRGHDARNFCTLESEYVLKWDGGARVEVYEVDSYDSIEHFGYIVCQ